MQKETEKKETKMSCPNALNPLSPSQFPSDLQSSFENINISLKGFVKQGGRLPQRLFCN